MTVGDPAKWNMRVSILYAIGIWGAVGSYAFLRYTGRIPEFPKVINEEVPEVEESNKVTYETAHNKTTIISKKDFVPYSTRLYNFIQSFSQPGSQDK